MVWIPQKQVWTQQPQYPVPASLFGRPLDMLFNGGAGPIDLAQGKILTIGSTVSFRPTQQGVSCVTTGTVASALTVGGGKTSAQTAVTFFGVLMRDGTSIYCVAAASSTSSAGSGFVLADADKTGQTLGITKHGVAGAPSYVTLSSRVWYALIASTDQTSGDYYVYAKSLASGTLLTATSSGFTSVSSGGNGTYGVGCGKSVDPSWNGAIAFMGMGFFYTPRTQAYAWLANPWQVFTP